MSYAVSALIGLIIGVCSIFSTDPKPPNPHEVENSSKVEKLNDYT
jgi:hypothetical protein